jgi:hypothetical protein
VPELIIKIKELANKLYGAGHNSIKRDVRLELKVSWLHANTGRTCVAEEASTRCVWSYIYGKLWKREIEQYCQLAI